MYPHENFQLLYQLSYTGEKGWTPSGIKPLSMSAQLRSTIELMGVFFWYAPVTYSHPRIELGS
ncbi:hypothetical protein D9M70_371270 [compost metagenome]